MTEECICCQKTLLNKKEYFEVSNSTTTGRLVCRECATEIGIKNFFSAGLHSKTSVLKKYVKLHPEKQDLLDKHNNEKKAVRDEILAEFSARAEKAKQQAEKAKLTEKQEEKYTCTRCGEVWYVDDFDKIKNIYNATTSKSTLSRVKNLSACPKCGSGATTHKTIKYWVDKKGNCVEREE